MKTKHLLLVLALALGLGTLAGAAGLGRNKKRSALSGVNRTLVNPTGDGVLDRLHPRNDGGYTAFWATTNSDTIEYVDGAGNQVWRRDFPPRASGEDTRVALDSVGITFWASTMRYILLENQEGVILRTGTWDMPDLDMDKILIRNDILYLVNGGVATMFDTAMNVIGETEVYPPGGYWRQYPEHWLIDLRYRTNQQVRVAVLGEALTVTNLFTVDLPTGRTGGYCDHTVLYAGDNLMFVASRVSWVTNSQLFFTAFDRSGNVLQQSRLIGRDSITGLAVLEDGWLLTGTGLHGGVPKQFVLRIGTTGIPQSREFYAAGDERRYFALNSVPPRLLNMTSRSTGQLLGLSVSSWDPDTMGDPDIDTFSFLRGAEVEMGETRTNYFWITPTRLNNSPR